MSGQRYEIVGAWDFAKIPDERLDLALKEFAIAIRMQRETLNLLDHIAESQGAPKGMFALGKAFTWIDDDEGVATITIKAPPSEGAA